MTLCRIKMHHGTVVCLLVLVVSCCAQEGSGNREDGQFDIEYDKGKKKTILSIKVVIFY